MLATLITHPLTPCAALERVEVEVVRPSAAKLTLTYAAIGAISDVRLPLLATPTRADDLWRATCFEAFLRDSESDAYLEFNFSSSGEWAAYRFGGYRAGMSRASGIAQPVIETRAAADRFELRALVDLGGFTPGPLALSAVIEEAGGVKSYWALAHPEGKPDFHHSAGFIFNLAAPERP